MAAKSTRGMYKALLDKIGRSGRLRLQAALQGVSETLARNASFLTDRARNSVTIGVPHYWATYLDQGRGVVTPVTAKVLVWFNDPKDDPRTEYGTWYPRRASQIRRLTKPQYDFGLRENRKRRAEGREPFMVVTQSAGPTQRPAAHFMDRAFSPVFRAEVDRLARAEVEKYVRANMIRDRDTATIRL